MKTGVARALGVGVGVGGVREDVLGAAPLVVLSEDLIEHRQEPQRAERVVLVLGVVHVQVLGHNELLQDGVVHGRDGLLVVVHERRLGLGHGGDVLRYAREVACPHIKQTNRGQRPTPCRQQDRESRIGRDQRTGREPKMVPSLQSDRCALGLKPPPPTYPGITDYCERVDQLDNHVSPGQSTPQSCRDKDASHDVRLRETKPPACARAAFRCRDRTAATPRRVPTKRGARWLSREGGRTSTAWVCQARRRTVLKCFGNPHRKAGAVPLDGAVRWLAKTAASARGHRRELRFTTVTQ